MSRIGVIMSCINVLCALLNTFWSLYWIRTLKNSIERDKEIRRNMDDN